jgi:hypothetical protein
MIRPQGLHDDIPSYEALRSQGKPANRRVPTKEEAERYADERMKEGGHYLVIPLSAYKTKFGRWSVN